MILEKSGVFVSPLRDTRLILIPEISSVPAAEVENMAQGGLASPQPHSRPEVAQADGRLLTGLDGTQGKPAELTCPYP